jgi:hypothetical protein
VSGVVNETMQGGAVTEAEVAELREALRCAHVELHALKASLAFRAAYAAARLLHAVAPLGTRRGRVSAYARTFLCWLFRWRRSLASRPAREELRAVLLELRPRAPEAPEIRHVAAQSSAPVFAIEQWEETPLLHESEVDELVTALWASLEPVHGARGM